MWNFGVWNMYFTNEMEHSLTFLYSFHSFYVVSPLSFLDIIIFLSPYHNFLFFLHLFFLIIILYDFSSFSSFSWYSFYLSLPFTFLPFPFILFSSLPFLSLSFPFSSNFFHFLCNSFLYHFFCINSSSYSIIELHVSTSKVNLIKLIQPKNKLCTCRFLMYCKALNRSSLFEFFPFHFYFIKKIIIILIALYLSVSLSLPQEIYYRRFLDSYAKTSTEIYFKGQ